MNVFETNLGHRLVERLITYLDKEKRIDWEQRRYEIAKEILAHTARFSDGGIYTGNPADAVKRADKLIEELKK